MCIISVEEFKGLKEKTLLYLSSEDDDLPYLEDSFKIVVDQGVNELVQFFRLVEFNHFPIVCYDDKDLELASKAFWIIDAMEFKCLVLAQSRGICRNFRPLPPLSQRDFPSHLDISRITNSILYISQEYSLDSPIVPNISKNLSRKSVKTFLKTQKIPTEANGFQLTGSYAEQIALLLRFIGNNVAVLLTQVKHRTKTVTSKSNDVYSSIAPPSEYFDIEDDLRSRKSLYPDPKLLEFGQESKRQTHAEGLLEKLQNDEDLESFEVSQNLENTTEVQEEHKNDTQNSGIKHYENTLISPKSKKPGIEKAEQKCSCFIV